MTSPRTAAAGLAGLDTTTPAVVLKFDPNVMHHGGLGAIRSLGRLGVPVYGVHESAWAPAAGSRYLRGRLVWRPNPEQVERTAAGLNVLADRIGRRAVLIPTDDAGAIFLAEHGGALAGRFLFAQPPAGLPRRLAGKDSLRALCREQAVAAPWTLAPANEAEALEFAAAVGYPVIAKLAAPWQATGLRSTTVVGREEELSALLRACARSTGGCGLLLQERVPAKPGDDWFVHAYCGAGSACRPIFTGVKDRSYPAHAGLTSYGRAVRNDRLRGQAADLAGRLGYRGILDLDLRRDARSGEYVLLDFNPRLGAQFRLLRDEVGVDVVRAAYADLTGQRLNPGEQVDGRAFCVENYDPLGALAYWRRGELGLAAWGRSVRRVDELAWFARDDLRPFGLMCARMGWRAISLPLARGGGRGADRDGAPRYRAGRAGRGGRPEQEGRPGLGGRPGLRGRPELGGRPEQAGREPSGPAQARRSASLRSQRQSQPPGRLAESHGGKRA